jgi:PhoH-like ATPase
MIADPSTASASPSPETARRLELKGAMTTKGKAKGTRTKEPPKSRNGTHGAPPKPHASGEQDRDVKTFVIDTNVLLHNPNALFVFKEHDVVIPFAVIEELDKLKKGDTDIGRNARQAIRHLDRLRQQGRLTEGVAWGETAGGVGVNGNGAGPGLSSQGGTIRIDIADHQRPGVLDEDSPDNRIIAVAWHLNQDNDRTVFVSKDLSARIKSDSLGVKTEDFENQKVDAEHLYEGFTEVTVDGSIIDELYKERMLPLESLREALTQPHDHGGASIHELSTNEFVLLKDADDEGHTGIARRLADTSHVIPITGPRKPVFGVMHRNVQQTMAMDLLLDDEIKFVTLLGSAGTGKTLLAIAAGMTKVFNEERYEKLLVARPIMPMGRDIGYLPGDKDEKLTAWMQPIFDNLGYLLSTRGSHLQNADSLSTEQRINKLMADGKLVLEPLTYIRGRSIPHQFMIVDEAQNLTPHEVKTIVSRVGEGTKLILTGDIGQIDNPYLDQSSNGLSYAVERMKGVGFVGHMTLTKSERSELASLAAARL